MVKHPPAISITMPLVMPLERRSAVPLHLQLYERLRQAILVGRLTGGTRLPATRTLASDLGVSRNTVMNAFGQLLAEGYIEGRVGAGTYVSRCLPDESLYVAAQSPGARRTNERSGSRRTISRRGSLLSAMPPVTIDPPSLPRAFRPGLPALDAFPSKIWASLLSRRWRNAPPDLLGPGEPAGYRPLREAIADYLRSARAVRCHPDQVVVTAGSQQALDLAARVLLDPGDAAWIEEPGYLGARGALLGAGAHVVPVPVDGEGLNIAAGMERAPQVRLIYVSPSCQYPLGVTMSLARRLRLLEVAPKIGAWVLEDDYNSEYRYANRPLAALQGLDTEGRVIYLGSFSKVLLPAIRLGYLVVPPDLVDAFIAMRYRTDIHPPTLEQAAVVDFIVEGHFARHIRRMRALYAERQAILVEAAAHELRGLLDVRPSDAGMHLVGWLSPGAIPDPAEDTAASGLALAHGVYAPPLSSFYLEPPALPGLLLGYTGVTEHEIRQGVRRLAAALGTS